MRTFVASLIVLLFCLPTISQAEEEENRYVLKGQGAENIILLGETLDKQCSIYEPHGWSFQVYRCQFLVEIQNTDPSMTFHPDTVGIWHCDWMNHDTKKDIDITCYALGLDDDD